MGIDPRRIYEWISLYQSIGEAGLVTTSKNTVYSAELKASAVSDYLSGKGSLADICRKYQIRSSFLGVLTPMEKHAIYLQVA